MEEIFESKIRIVERNNELYNNLGGIRSIKLLVFVLRLAKLICFSFTLQLCRNLENAISIDAFPFGEFLLLLRVGQQ